MKLYQSHILICCEKELNCKIIRVRFVELKGLPDVLTITRDNFLSENDMKSFLRCQQQQKQQQHNINSHYHVLQKFTHTKILSSTIMHAFGSRAYTLYADGFNINITLQENITLNITIEKI